MLMAMSMKVNGSMIVPQVKVIISSIQAHTIRHVEPSTKANGARTNSMAMASKPGLTRQSIRVTIAMVKSTERGSLCGKTIVVMRAISSKTTFMVMASTYGTMAELMRENG